MFELITVKDTIQIEPRFMHGEASLAKLKIENSGAANNGAALSTTANTNPANNEFSGGAVVAQSPTSGGSGGFAASSSTSFRDIIWHRICDRYVGKVVPKHGYCITVGDVLEFGETHIVGGEETGSAYTSVTVQLVVFHPQVGENFRAHIKKQGPEGITMSTDFFDAILVPPHLLVTPSHYDKTTGVWALEVESGGGGGGDGNSNSNDNNANSSDAMKNGELSNMSAPTEVTHNPYKNNDEVTMCVHHINMVGDPANPANSIDGNKNNAGAGGAASPFYAGDADNEIPMQIIGSFLGTGLGPVAWYS